MKVARICGCGAVVKGKCSKCESKKKHFEDYFRESAQDRGYDYQWRKLSKRFRAHNPLCMRCKKNGKVTVADDVHHIKPIKTHPSLRLVWDNLMSVCRTCHREIEREDNG